MNIIKKALPYLIIKKTSWFTLFFYPLLLFFAVLDYKNIELFNFDRGIVSIATLSKVDIGLRISIFYHALIYAALAFVASLVIFNTLSRSGIASDRFTKMMNYLSFAGLLGIFLRQVSACETHLIKVIVVLHVLLFLNELGLTIMRKEAKNHFGKDFYLWVGLTAFFLLFPLRELFVFLRLSISIDFFYMMFPILASIVFVCTYLLFFRYRWPLKRIIYISSAFMFLPFVSFLSNEIYMVFNQRGIELVQSKYLYCLLSLFVWVYFFVLLKIGKNKFGSFSIRRFLFKRYVPFFIVGVIIYLNYSTFITQSEELFELANPANSVLRFFNFGEVPIFQYLSSHMLSEQILPFIYTFLNGFDGSVGFMIYNFVLIAINYLIVYYFLYFYFKNPYLAFFVSVFYPFTVILIPFSLSFTLISVILLVTLLKSYTFRRFLLFSLWVLFLCLWKPEVGLENFMVSAIFLMGYLIIRFSKKLCFDYIKIAFFIGIPIILITLTLQYVLNTNVISCFRQALGYFSANQAHGYVGLTYDENKYFYYHYFIFPMAVLVMLILLLFHKGITNLKKWTNARYLILIMFIGIYFIQAQRGLVRHSMIEGTDTFMSSFLFLIAGFSVVYFTNIRIQKGILFLIIVTSIINIFKWPDSNGYSSILSLYVSSPNKFETVLPSKTRINRVLGQKEFADKTYQELNRFLLDNISDRSTFYDFSNTPMLYFYTCRQIPSYFNQIPTSLNDYPLQKANLEELKKIDIPVVIFSNIPLSYWDKVDDVPNVLRHYLLAEWMYENYHPYAIINKHVVWLRNTGVTQIEKTNEREIFKKSHDNFPIKVSLPELPEWHHYIIKVKQSKNNLKDITVNGKIIKPFRLESNNLNSYYVSSSQDNSYFLIDGHGKFENMIVKAAKYCPDTFSYKRVNFNLMKLAYIMGEYTETKNAKIFQLSYTKDSDTLGKYKVELPLDVMVDGRLCFNMDIKPVSKAMNVEIKFFSGQLEQGTFNFEIVPDKKLAKYKIPLYTQYNWHISRPSSLSICFKPNGDDYKEIISSMYLIKE